MDAGLTQPKRKGGHKLTLIPEQERFIAHRFNVSLVGQGAHDFALRVCDSEVAQAFHPTAKKESDGNLDAGQKDGSSKHTEVSPHSYHHGHNDEEDMLVLFCPTANNAKELARLRFVPLEKFTDSLPTTKDTAVAMNTAVVLLFWHVEDDAKEREPGMTPTEERISDISSRIAELNHMSPAFRPYSTIYAFAVDDEQEAALKDITKISKHNIELVCFPDDEEETVMDSMQALSDKVMNHRNFLASQSRTFTANLATDGVKAGKCGCTIA